MAELLGLEGFQVSCASNGREGLELLESSPELPGLILLDLMMPEMDGYEFREAQLRDPRLAGIPVLIMTAGSDIELKAQSLGVHGYLQKPFADIETILGVVASFFS